MSNVVRLVLEIGNQALEINLAEISFLPQEGGPGRGGWMPGPGGRGPGMRELVGGPGRGREREREMTVADLFSLVAR